MTQYRLEKTHSKDNKTLLMIIAAISKNKGRPLTPEEITLVLAQARAIHGDDLTG